MEKFFTYFSLSAPERKGYLFLLVLICLLLAFPWMSGLYDHKTVVQDSIYEWVAAEEAKEFNRRRRTSRASGPEDSPQKKAAVRSELFDFNPNNLSESAWLALGLSKGQIRVIHKYEAHGGVFHVKEDVKKIYVLPETTYMRLAPYIKIPTDSQRLTSTSRYRSPKAKALPHLAVVDINDADSLAFQKLAGIGPVLGSRIVRYREALGGFHSLAQLLEVYGIDSSLYTKLLPQLYQAGTWQPTIAINTITAVELATHPYLSRKQAGIIINYRNAHGLFGSFDDFKKISALDLDILRKIEPYLKF